MKPESPASSSFAGHSADWDRLRELLGKSRSGGPGALSEPELWELPSLYRRTLSDLSLLRTSGSAPQLEHELTRICNAAHALIYRGAAPHTRFNLWRHIAYDLPEATRRNSRMILLCALTMAIFTVIGWAHAELNPQLAESVLGPQMSAGIRTSLKTARESADLGLAAQIEPKDRVAMWLAITLNNWAVSFRAALFGIAAGVLTLLVVAFNGYMLGVVAFIYLHTDPGIPINLPLYFFAGIAPHGSIELPAICVAGGAGMLLGLSWLFPGQRPRGEALRAAASDFWKLVQVCLLTLIVAGLIEGFVTPLNPPAGLPLDYWHWLKICFGLVVDLLWLVWLTRRPSPSTSLA
jgi:uncharacterized membrane protein SpoIIM required for sporulation